MTVASNSESIGKCISLLNEDLVSDAPTSGEEVDTVLASERLDGKVFGEVFFRFVLDIVIEGENKLSGVSDLCSTYGFEPGVEKISPKK